MNKLLPTNEHVVERVLRIALGIVLLSLAFVGPKAWWGWFGAQVFTPLAETATALRPGPRSIAGRASPISPGSSPRVAVSPSPSWPWSFAPQHLIAPSSSSAHV